MNKKLLVIAIILLVVSLVFILLNADSDITGAVVAGQKKCLSPKSALKFINKGCVRIYEDQACADAGKVEIKC